MKSKNVKVSSPSNIALIKYWGKLPNQIPANPSLSFTLNKCNTTMDISLEEKKDNIDPIKIYLDGVENKSFVTKISNFFSKIKTEYPIVENYKWIINTSNSFPHSSGIASSASSMSALAMAIIKLEKGKKIDINEVSFLARIGSGSACRSVHSLISLWGKNNYIPSSHNSYAIEFTENIDEVFLNYCDSILIVSSEEKSISSTLGHNLMNNNPYAKARYIQANENLLNIIDSLRNGDLELFGNIVEMEAMALHSLMMLSNPSFMLLKPNTLNIISKVLEFRKESKIPLYYTLDAGPNIHLLYPNSFKEKIIPFINEELLMYTENNNVIHDFLGNGTKII